MLDTKYVCTFKLFLGLFLLVWQAQNEALATQGCGSVVNNTLKSPGYPSNYPNDISCVYRVSIPPNMALKIVFEYFHLEYGFPCSSDYLEIADENNATVDKFCGDETGKEVLVGGNYAVLKFSSDFSVREKGFEISFKAAKPTLPKILLSHPAPSMLVYQGRKLSCAITANGTLPIYVAFVWNSLVLVNKTKSAEVVLMEQGNYSCVATNKYGSVTKVIVVSFLPCLRVVNNALISPGYPNNYPNNIHCIQKLPIPHHMALKFVFHNFDVELYYRCGYDYLEIADNNNAIAGKYCGNQTGKVVVVGGDYAVFTFYSDSSAPAKGFVIIFTVVQPIPPRILLPNPAPVVRVYEGQYLQCSAIGTLPVYVSITDSTSYLFGNRTNSLDAMMKEEGNYTCVATNRYGTDKRVIPVMFKGCDAMVNNTLTSHRYPNKYLHNLDCEYKVPSPQGMALQIYFKDFYVQSHFSCNSDYLQIAGVNYCGYQTRRFVLVSVNTQNLHIIFHTNGAIEKRGFVIQFAAVENVCRLACSYLRSAGFWKTWSCKNVTSLKSIVKCVPTTTKKLHLFSSTTPFLADDLFDNLTNLVLLDLRSNAIVHLSGVVFAKLRKLQILDLSSNAIATLPEDSFMNLTNLEKLTLSSNTIKLLPDGVFAKLAKLRSLSLSSNAIRVLPEGVFASLQDLQHLYLISNEIEFLPERVFDNLTKLHVLDMSSNRIAALPERLFLKQSQLYTLSLKSNNITRLPEGVFSSLKILDHLDLSSNSIKVLPEGVFSYLKQLNFLDLSSNCITALPGRVFSNLKDLGDLYLSSNAIKVLPDGVFGNLTELWTLHLESNFITELPKGAFDNLKKIRYLFLQSNNITVLPDRIFGMLNKLEFLSLWNNKISNISNATFANTTELQYLFLGSNRLKMIPSGAFSNLNSRSSQVIILSDNPIKTIEPKAFRVLDNKYASMKVFLQRANLKKLSLGSFINISKLDSKLLIKTGIPRTLKFSSARCIIYLNTNEAVTDAVEVKHPTNIIGKPTVAALLASGFTKLSKKRKDYLYLIPCPVGTFSNSSSQGAKGCIPCPPGGYYSDTAGFVSTGCRKCPNGSFVAFHKAPGTQVQDCKTCPLGTQTDSFAGLRACPCLEGHYRNHLFGKCEKCGLELKCQNEYAALNPGYWWRWRNKTHKDRYRLYIANLVAASPALGHDDVEYPFALPTPYQCPEKESCEGGINSTCKDGYTGPLCSVCRQEYYKQLHKCTKCPSKAWTTGQLAIIFAVFLVITAVCVWTSKRKNQEGGHRHSVIDMFLSKIKIAIGFYQVTYGCLEAFWYIKWPESLQAIGYYSGILQFNVLQIAPVHCLFPGMKADAFANLFAIMAINALIIAMSGVIYAVRKATLLRQATLQEKSDKLAQLKEAVYKNLFFLLYVTYLSTCSKTATVLPLACRELCQDVREHICAKYVKSDYSIRCDDHRYKKLVVVAFLSTVYVLALPIIAFLTLWKQRRTIIDADNDEISDDPRSDSEIIKAMHFLYENYKTSLWYWELVEMSRKVIVTSGLILVGQESRSYIGLAWVIAGMYGVLFAWNCPIIDAFENQLMTTSLAVTVFNLGIGAISKIPAEKLPSSTNSDLETVTLNILVLGANTLVIGLLAFQYFVHIYGYLREWRKNPQWSFSCFLALILPLLSLPADISGLAGTNLTNSQLDTGNVDMPTVTAAVQDSGAVEVTLEGSKDDEDVSTDAKTDSSSNEQLQSEEKQRPVKAAAVKGNGKLGAILVKGNCGHDREITKTLDGSVSRAQTGEIEVIDARTKYARVGVYDPVEMESSHKHPGAMKNSRKCYQGTQTELLTIFPRTDLMVYYEPVTETEF